MDVTLEDLSLTRYPLIQTMVFLPFRNQGSDTFDIHDGIPATEG